MVVADASQNFVGLAFRVQDASDFWTVVQVPELGGWVLYKTVDGTTTNVGSAVVPVQVGDHLSVTSVGAAVSVFVNGKKIISVSDSALDDQTGVGLWAAQSGPVASGFVAGGVSGGESDQSFDADGRVTATVGPQTSGANMNATETAYDADGNEISHTDGNGHVTHEAYDAVGNLVSQTDGNGNATTYGYDLLGRVISTKAPGKNTEQIAYANGDMSGATPVWPTKTVTEPSGVIATTTYDSDGRVKGVAYSDSTPAVSNTWDSLGRLTESDAGSVHTSWTYDSLGEVTQVTRAGRKVSYALCGSGSCFVGDVSEWAVGVAWV